MRFSTHTVVNRLLDLASLRLTPYTGVNDSLALRAARTLPLNARRQRRLRAAASAALTRRRCIDRHGVRVSGSGSRGMPLRRRKRGFAVGELVAAQRRGAGGACRGRAGAERVRAMAAVAVRGEDVGVPVADEPHRPLARLGPVAAEQGADVDLQQRAGSELGPQQLVAAGEEALRRAPGGRSAALKPDSRMCRQAASQARHRCPRRAPRTGPSARPRGPWAIRSRSVGESAVAPLGMDLAARDAGAARCRRRRSPPAGLACARRSSRRRAGNSAWPTCGVTVASWTPSRARRSA